MEFRARSCAITVLLVNALIPTVTVAAQASAKGKQPAGTTVAKPTPLKSAFPIEATVKYQSPNIQWAACSSG